MTEITTPTSAGISPVAQGQFFDSNGKPLAGGLIFGYVNGSSSIKQPLYTEAGDYPVANTNPIVLDSGGYLVGGLFLDTTLTYTIVVTKPDGTTVIQQWDNVVPVVGP